MDSNTHRHLIWDGSALKDITIILSLLIGINVFLFRENLLYYSIFLFLVLTWYFYRDVGFRVSTYFEVQKKRLPDIIRKSIFFGFLTVWIYKYSTYDNQSFYGINIVTGVVIFLVSVFLIYKSKTFHIRKKPEDFPNLKQEQMYDEVDSLDVFQNFRLKKVPKFKTITKKKFFGLWEQKVTFQDGFEKIVDYSDIDLRVTDDKNKNLLPRVKKEIKDIINEENLDFYGYKLTRLKELEIDSLMKKLTLDESKMIKSKHKRKGVTYEDGYRFLRFWYQQVQKNLKTISTEGNTIEYDFLEALYKFDGVLEYAFIDMYMFQSNYLNRPIGNTKALALKDDIFNGNTNMIELCGAMDSSLFTSIKRRGIAYLAGYYLTLKDRDLMNPIETLQNREQS